MAELIESIADLKREVERLERKVEFLFRHLHLDYVESDLPSYMIEATALVRNGRRNDAVKVIREYTAIGTVEARAQVDQIERDLGIA